MDLREAVPADRSGVAALARERCPHLEPWLVDGLFTGAFDLDTCLVAVEGDALVGFGFSGAPAGTPVGQHQMLVLVATSHDDAGLGRSLYDQCRAAQPSTTTDLRARVFDDDPRALAVAEHWGFEVVQRSITSRLELGDVDPPVPPDGVTLEAADDLAFDDADAVEAMFAASQTNPEARNNHLMTIEEMTHWAFPGERALGSLARVDGVPAAIAFALVEDGGDSGGVGYTGVDPRFRGRGLGRLVKEDVHHRAAGLGIRTLGTDNEEHNQGIRRLNAELGYQVTHGVYRMRQLL
jgi:GNAT superfamily N-acetyltransferase